MPSGRRCCAASPVAKGGLRAGPADVVAVPILFPFALGVCWLLVAVIARMWEARTWPAGAPFTRR